MEHEPLWGVEVLTGMLLDVWPSDLLVECYCPLPLSLTLAHPLFYSSGRMVIHPTAPVSTSTPLLTGSCSIETLVSCLAYLLGLGHTGTHKVNSQLWGAIVPHRKTIERQDNLYATGKRSNFHMIFTVFRYSAQQHIAQCLKCSEIYIEAYVKGALSAVKMYSGCNVTNNHCIPCILLLMAKRVIALDILIVR